MQADWAWARHLPSHSSLEFILAGRRPIFRLAQGQGTFGWQGTRRMAIGFRAGGISSASATETVTGLPGSKATVAGAGTTTWTAIGIAAVTGTAIVIATVSADNPLHVPARRRPLPTGEAAFRCCAILSKGRNQPAPLPFNQPCRQFPPIPMRSRPALHDSFFRTAT